MFSSKDTGQRVEKIFENNLFDNKFHTVQKKLFKLKLNNNKNKS